jgi:membrane protease subunit HflC
MKKLMVILAVVLVAVIVLLMAGPFYILNEGEQVVVVRFGQIVKVEKDAGLKFKSPFVDNLVVYPKKVMSWDGESRQIQTKENQLIWVDTTARWKIVDPIRFYSAVSTMESAYGKLDDVIDNAVRTIVSQNRLIEAVRSTNNIKESTVVENYQTGDAVRDEALRNLTQSTTTFETIEKGRKKLSAEMLIMVKAIAIEYGIEIIDIVIREIAYTEDQVNKIYERMTTERSQLAKAYRSSGEGAKADLIGNLQKDQDRIMSEARRKAAAIIGAADAEASNIYAQAYSRDPEFFTFWRSLESYKLTMPNFNKTMTTDMDYFKYLYSPTGNR